MKVVTLRPGFGLNGFVGLDGATQDRGALRCEALEIRGGEVGTSLKGR